MLLPSPITPSSANLKPSSIPESPSSNSRSLRSLALLLNDLPPSSNSHTVPSYNQQSARLNRSSGANDSLEHYQKNLASQNNSREPDEEISNKQSHDSQYSASPSSSTKQTFSPPSPSAYHSYHPEWTSISSPVLPHSLGNLSHPPPRKKTRAIEELGSSQQSLSDYHTVSSRYSRHSFHPIRPKMLLDQEDLSQVNEDEIHDCSDPTSISRPSMLDEDRGLSSRPLKNTKRAAQNRAAQRAFRERKDRYVRELEARSVQFDEYIMRHGLLEERERILAAREAEVFYRPREDNGIPYVNHLEQQLEKSRREVATLRLQINPKQASSQQEQPSSSSSTTWEQSSSLGDGTGFSSLATSGSASDLTGRRDSSSSVSSFFAQSDSVTESSSHKFPALLQPSRSYPPIRGSEQFSESITATAHSRRPLLSIAIGGSGRAKPDEGGLNQSQHSDRMSPESLSHPYSAPCLSSTKSPSFERARIIEEDVRKLRSIKPIKDSIRLPSILNHHHQKLYGQKTQAGEPAYTHSLSMLQDSPSNSRSDGFKYPTSLHSRSSHDFALSAKNSNLENHCISRSNSDPARDYSGGRKQ
ncbi:hypothetical protein BY996DRAFT_6410517 [Phakopsora pachyrhizi]|nr:hypothetical protein BY996DRAFT_6410517 [Phakopsora pachyrhizi]